ncbi:MULTISPECIES: DUF5671 domain-containing protein [Acidiphilium]|jgi:hypothetical protein|uniref:DUF5671 domain-containing protein n=1 Tax=Acidiphilium cryptum (strain JF-5) TaxID=349163 RepID=A5G1S3_ACICJ|nr:MULTISPECIES: DUF5671 domain-containing protein [Acidiphilium]ABQ31805.1 hypothetical protein Acry_2614 [Acidiphilium cryptum JF-5]EGO94414.1 hypothetical protein APM_2760 [Acidiphilium sp. PM]
MDRQLLDFTRRALAAGAARAEIAAALRAAGWQDADIGEALHAFAEVPFPVPVPRAQPYLSAREVFVYLVVFVALYTAAYNAGALAFHLIDHAFPRRIGSRIYVSATLLRDIRWNISAILVAYPVFVVLFRRINRAIARDPARRGSRPRQWLTYLTLFITALWLAGDVMALIYNALGGELAVATLLKLATVAVIAGGMFGYFLRDAREAAAP